MALTGDWLVSFSSERELRSAFGGDGYSYDAVSEPGRVHDTVSTREILETCAGTHNQSWVESTENFYYLAAIGGV